MCAQKQIPSFFKPLSGSERANLQQKEEQKKSASAIAIETEKKSSNVASTSSKHRHTGINKDWKTQFPWLIFTKVSEVDEGTLCSICVKFAVRPTKGVDVWLKTPCTRMRRESIVDHSKSLIHEAACKKAAEAKELESSGSGQIERSISRLNNLQRSAFVGALRCIYWLAENELPYMTLYKKLLSFCEQMGCEYLEHLTLGKNATYMSDETAQELLQVLAAKIRTRVTTDIQSSEFFSVICDETTDIAVLKQLIIYVKYVSKHSGPSVTFLSIADITDGKAETITIKILEILRKYDLPLNKLVGLGSDGAAVMVGQQNGVCKLLKDETNGMLVNCHCIAHRLALACAEAANEVKYLKKFKDIIRQLFYFFHNSPVRMSGLTELQKLLESPEIKLKLPSDTRWLSHDAAVQALRRSFVAVIAALEREATERNDCTAAGLAKFMKTYNFVASLLMFSDALPILSILSKYWQREDTDMTSINEILNGTISALKLLIQKPEKHFSSLDHLLDKDWNVLKKDLGQTVKDKLLFKSDIYEKFLENVIQNLRDRFPDIPVMDAFSILTSEFYILNDQETAETKFELLLNHYSTHGIPPPIDKSAAEKEFQVVLPMLKSEDYRGLANRQCLMKLAKHSDIIPNIGKLANIALTLAVSSVDCERGFSALKRVKTPLRNRLKEETLNNLLMISIEGEGCANFDFESAADEWASKKSRRISIR